LTKLSIHFFSYATLIVAALCYTPAHAESNVMGEEITILPDDTFKPNHKDLGSTENLGVKKSSGYNLDNTLDTDVDHNSDSQQDATNQDVINIGSDDLWQRIKEGYAIPNNTSSLVINHENWYSSRPDYIRRMVERSQRYLFHIVEEVEKRGMPTEIALLPMIESAYNPQAYSKSHASGIWQFIPSTGVHFGLKQNWWVDNRRNVTFATDAALTYLQKLYGMFGSWDLALAAYNAGEGTVGRAIERNRKLGLATDYESINLPPETRNYVPKLQAIKNLMTNPSKYGLNIQTIANTAYFTRVSAPTQIDARLAAKLAEISDDEFLALNPSNNRPVITNNGEKHELLLPILSAQTFRDNLANYNKPLVSWQTYQTKRGERMENIASKFGIQLAQLRNVNNLPAQNKIKKSSTILVPNGNKTEYNPSKLAAITDAELAQPTDTNNQVSANQSSTNLNLESMGVADSNTRDDDDAENNKNKIEPVKHSSVTHKVKKGDTLQSISRRYDVSIAQIMKLNALKNNRVKMGQTLKIETITKKQGKTLKKSTGKKESVRNKSSRNKVKSKNNSSQKKKKPTH
jgi:membrane-bound lytic murein transglycosylase D